MDLKLGLRSLRLWNFLSGFMDLETFDLFCGFETWVAFGSARPFDPAGISLGLDILDVGAFWLV